VTVSLVIPSFNRRRWLAETLPSYRAVRAVREIIVVDDGSRDGTADLVNAASQEDPRISLVRHERNRGLPAARNSGVAAARYDFVCFGEDEVVFEPDYVEVLLRHLEEQHADVIAGPRPPIESFETRREELQRYVRSASMRIPWSLDYRLAVPTDVDVEWPFLNACALMRKGVALGLRYDEGIAGNSYREESDFYLRAVAAGYRLMYCPHTACYHLPVDRSTDDGGCWSDRSRVRRTWSATRNNWRFVRRHQRVLSRFSLPNPLLLQAAFVARRGRGGVAAIKRLFS